MIELREVNSKLDKLQLLRRNALFRLINNDDNTLHFGQMPLLEYIVKHDGCTQAETAEHLGVSPASIAVSTKRMQRVGLIEKKEDESNLRCKNLYITEKGRKVFVSCKAIFDEFDLKVYSGLSPEDIGTLCRIIDKMTENITENEENNLKPEDFIKMRNKHHKLICDSLNDRRYDNA